MGEEFFSRLAIKQVRHLRQIDIFLSKTERKNLIITGKNGVGKTSVLVYLKEYIEKYFDLQDDVMPIAQYLEEYEILADECDDKAHIKEQLEFWIRQYENANMENWNRIGERELMEKKREAALFWDSTSDERIFRAYQDGKFVFAFFSAERALNSVPFVLNEKTELKRQYRIDENPSTVLLSYLVDLKIQQAFAIMQGDKGRSEEIDLWFRGFEDLLQKVFDDKSLELHFDYNEKTFCMTTETRMPFGFDELSSGYSSVLYIIVELLLRIEKSSLTFLDVQGVVLIDEIESHLHLEMQKNIMPFLTTMFPKIQFIVTTHSPFILNSTRNAVIYDLENQILVREGFDNLPYQGIVEGYFRVDVLSEKLKENFSQYVELAGKERKTDEDYRKLAELEMYLNKIPDYLSLDISTEYQRIKLELQEGGR